MAPEIIASIIGAAGSVAGAGASAASAAMANRRAYKWSKKYYQFQNEYNLENYSPALQMQRLRDAGINPHEANGTLSSPSGSMSVPEYQNPIDPNAIPNAVSTAYNMYLQKKSIDNATSNTVASVDAAKAQADRNRAETAKTQYYTSMIQPWEAVGAKHKSTLAFYQAKNANLTSSKLLNEISLLGLTKQKYQLGLDLLNIEKQYADQWWQSRISSVKADAANKWQQNKMGAIDLKNYQDLGIRPNDPYYLRIGKNIIDDAIGNPSSSSGGLKGWLKRMWTGEPPKGSYSKQDIEEMKNPSYWERDGETIY